MTLPSTVTLCWRVSWAAVGTVHTAAHGHLRHFIRVGQEKGPPVHHRGPAEWLSLFEERKRPSAAVGVLHRHERTVR